MRAVMGAAKSTGQAEIKQNRVELADLKVDAQRVQARKERFEALFRRTPIEIAKGYAKDHATLEPIPSTSDITIHRSKNGYQIEVIRKTPDEAGSTFTIYRYSAEGRFIQKEHRNFGDKRKSGTGFRQSSLETRIEGDKIIGQLKRVRE